MIGKNNTEQQKKQVSNSQQSEKLLNVFFHTRRWKEKGHKGD